MAARGCLASRSALAVIARGWDGSLGSSAPVPCRVLPAQPFGGAWPRFVDRQVRTGECPMAGGSVNRPTPEGGERSAVI